MTLKFLNAGLAGAAALALSVTAAQAELTEKAMSNETVANVVQRLNTLPFIGDNWHIAEQLAGRGLSQANKLDENPLAYAGVTLGSGVAGGFIGNAVGTALTGGAELQANAAAFAE